MSKYQHKYNYVCATYVDLLSSSGYIEPYDEQEFVCPAHKGDTGIVTQTGQTYIFTGICWEKY